MGVFEVLTIVFVVLKLTRVIAWSWWLVLLPEIIAFVLYVVGLIVWGTIGTIGFKKAKKEIKKFDDDFFNEW